MDSSSARVKTKPESPRITPTRKKEDRTKVLASIVETPPLDQLRLYLSIGSKPPSLLVDSKNISAAIPLDDCWKYARLLSVSGRTIDASALLKACRILMDNPARLNIRRCAKGLLSIAKLWQDMPAASIPTETTASAFLSAMNTLLDIRAENKHQTTGKQDIPKHLLAEIVSESFQLLLLYPTLGALLQLAELLTKAITRHSLDFDLVVVAPDGNERLIDALWRRLIAELGSAIKAVRLNDLRLLLRATSTFPGKQREFRSLVDDYLSTRDDIERGCRSLLSEYSDAVEQEEVDPVVVPDGGDQVENIELARVVMKAWDLEAGIAQGQELAQEVRTTIDRLFGLRVFGNVGEEGEYEPRFHEFEPGVEVSDAVIVVRPGILKVTPYESIVVFKAVVNARREDLNVK